jgi:glycosyltransferase domain-containing protein
MLRRLIHEVVGKKAVQAENQSTAAPTVVEIGWKDRFLAPSIPGLTMLVPFLPTRLAFLDAMLEHLDQAAVDVPILMSVSHDEGAHAGVEEIVARHPRQRVVLVFHATSISIFDRLVLLARQASTRYVFIHSDDDFVVPKTLADSVDYLEKNLDYVACQGRLAFFRPSAKGISTGLQTGETLYERSPSKRLLRQCADFTTTFHAVTRRASFIEAHELTLRHSDNIIFVQYLASCALLALGKFKTLEDIYYLRLDNPIGERAKLIRARDKTHWPYLVIADGFSAELGKFRGGLAEAAARAGEAMDEVALDDCCLALVRRAFGLMRSSPLPDSESSVNLRAESTPERAFLLHCVALATAALKATQRQAAAIA